MVGGEIGNLVPWGGVSPHCGEGAWQDLDGCGRLARKIFIVLGTPRILQISSIFFSDAPPPPKAKARGRGGNAGAKAGKKRR